MLARFFARRRAIVVLARTRPTADFSVYSSARAHYLVRAFGARTALRYLVYGAL